MKHHLLRLLVAMGIILTTTPCLGEYIDLMDSLIIGDPIQCRVDNKTKICVLVEKEVKTYRVILDEKGEYAIYLVDLKKEGKQITVINSRLLWSRQSV